MTTGTPVGVGGAPGAGGEEESWGGGRHIGGDGARARARVWGA
jgi:hypothetical protein